MQSWERARNRAGALDIFAVAITGLAILLAGLTVATTAVLVTGRMAAQGRQIGALKAVGLTPRQALAVVLLEYLAVATVAAAIGITAGTLLSPLIGRDLPHPVRRADHATDHVAACRCRGRHCDGGRRDRVGSRGRTQGAAEHRAGAGLQSAPTKARKPRSRVGGERRSAVDGRAGSALGAAAPGPIHRQRDRAGAGRCDDHLGSGRREAGAGLSGQPGKE
jgi:hypothetical protein